MWKIIVSMEVALEYYFTLNYFKDSLEYSDFSVKILNFLWRSGEYNGVRGLRSRTPVYSQ